MSLAPGTSNPAIRGNHWGAAALTLAGEPVGRRKRVRGWQTPDRWAPLGKASATTSAAQGEGRFL